MFPQELSPPYPSPEANGFRDRFPRPAQRLSGLFARRLWLHALLFLLTLFTTTVVGARMQHNFRKNLPFLDVEQDLNTFARLWSNPAMLLDGLPFSLTLLAILTAHELGHFLACAFYRVQASLPYFLPAPTFTGTFGAFIRIRSPIYSKRVLFDIGIAGPIAGFVFLLPALGVGLAFSKIIPGIEDQGYIRFGTPPLVWLLEQVIFPGVSTADIYLHPVARAAWIGILATALNLLPIGQLDGGHILYSIVGDKHRLFSRLFVALLIPIGWFWPGWLVWALILLIFNRHPRIYDPSRLSRARLKLAWLALAIFLLCFTLTPVSAS